jgi:hypothetical protein
MGEATRYPNCRWGARLGVTGRAARGEGREERVRAAAVSRLTVRRLCDQYLECHVDRNRKPEGAAEVRRLFDRMRGF